jgi:hypothetical protein
MIDMRQNAMINWGLKDLDAMENFFEKWAMPVSCVSAKKAPVNQKPCLRMKQPSLSLTPSFPWLSGAA